MAVYMIAAMDIEDSARFGDYEEAAGAILPTSGATPVIIDDTAALLEGEMPGSRFVMLRFESEEEFYAWYNSDSYKKARSIRHESANTRFLVLAKDLSTDQSGGGTDV